MTFDDGFGLLFELNPQPMLILDRDDLALLDANKACLKFYGYERAEFLSRALSKDGQQLMLDYMETTDATGELPLYSPGIYQRALESGTVPGARSANGALSRP